MEAPLFTNGYRLTIDNRGGPKGAPTEPRPRIVHARFTRNAGGPFGHTRGGLMLIRPRWVMAGMESGMCRGLKFEQQPYLLNVQKRYVIARCVQLAVNETRQVNLHPQAFQKVKLSLGPRHTLAQPPSYRAAQRY